MQEDRDFPEAYLDHTVRQHFFNHYLFYLGKLKKQQSTVKSGFRILSKYSDSDQVSCRIRIQFRIRIKFLLDPDPVPDSDQVSCWIRTQFRIRIK